MFSLLKYSEKVCNKKFVYCSKVWSIQLNIYNEFHNIFIKKKFALIAIHVIGCLEKYYTLSIIILLWEFRFGKLLSIRGESMNCHFYIQWSVKMLPTFWRMNFLFTNNFISIVLGEIEKNINFAESIAPMLHRNDFSDFSCCCFCYFQTS